MKTATAQTTSSLNIGQQNITSTIDKFEQSVSSIEESISTHSDNLKNVAELVLEIKSNFDDKNLEVNQNVEQLLTRISSVISEIQTATNKSNEDVIQAIQSLGDDIKPLIRKLEEVAAAQPENSGLLSKLFRS